MTITPYDFDLSFLKILLKSTFYGLSQDMVYFLLSIILQQNNHIFSILRQSLYLSYLSPICLCILCHKHYQCSS